MQLTSAVLEIISAAIQNTNSTNRRVICEETCRLLEEKYTKRKLEYQAKRMKLYTTGQIYESIDSYFLVYANQKVTDMY